MDCFDTDCANLPACAGVGGGGGSAWGQTTSTCGATGIYETGTYYGYSSEQATYSRYSGSCGGSSAPETIYSFSVDYADTVCVNTVGSAYDTLLYVRQGCSGTEVACNDDTYGLQSEVQFYAQPGVDYHVFVDGYGSNSGSYSVAVNFGPCGSTTDPYVDPYYNNGGGYGEDCYNGWDDDGDGWIDCEDADCSWDASCPSYCYLASPIYETGSLYGNTTWDVSYSEWYSDCGGLDAPESIYSFSLGYSDTVCIDTIGSTFDTLLYVIEGCGGTEVACNDDWVGLQSQLELYAMANTTYYVFVDGYSSYSYGDYYLNIELGPCGSGGEICGNGYDDDYDGWIDCDDWDCTSDPACYQAYDPLCDGTPEYASITNINVLSPDNTYRYCNDALEIEFYSDRITSLFVEIGAGGMVIDAVAGYNRVTVAQSGEGATMEGFDGNVLITPFNPCTFAFGGIIDTGRAVYIGEEACSRGGGDDDDDDDDEPCSPFNPNCR